MRLMAPCFGGPSSSTWSRPCRDARPAPLLPASDVPPPEEIGPIATWVIAGMGTIIIVLGSAVATLFWILVRRIAKLEAENSELRAIAASSSTNVGAMVPAVRELTTAVDGVDRKAIDRYETIRRDVKELRDEILDALRARRGAR